jgi:ATP-binding cassette subfamily B protein
VTIVLPSRWRKRAVKPSAAVSQLDAADEELRYKPIEWPLLRRLIGWLAPYKKQYALGIALGLAYVLLEMLGPKFMQGLIDYVSAFTTGKLPAPTPAPALLGRIDPLAHLWSTAHDRLYHHPIAFITSIIVIWAMVFAVSINFQRLCILTMTRTGEKVQFDLRRALFAHLQELSMSYYDKTKLGRIISRCTSDIGAMREVNVWGIWQVVANFTMMCVAAAMLLWTDWRLFLSVCWLAPIIFCLNHVYRKKAGAMHQISREGWTKVSTNLAENITGMRVVTAFNRQAPNLGVFNALQQVNTYNNVNVARVNGIYQPLLSLIGFTGKVIILLFGGYLVVSGRINNTAGQVKGVGAVVAAFLYWDWFMNPILNFGNFYNTLMQAMAGAERVFSLLDTRPDVMDEPQARPLPRIIGRVTFENVTFGYNPDRPVLHDISFEAQPGQTFALVGATGSGKSSIISLIARFYQPQKGRVLVDGHDIRHVTGQSLHKQMGLVLQVNYLFSGTVMENIRYARPEASDRDVIDAARAIGSYDAIMTLSDGFNSEVGERGANMSLGQRQLICFTRAFLADPRIFMLDEATSAVDTATDMLVQHSLQKLLAGRTTFIVAHRLSTILSADQILVVEAGRIIERGTHGQLVAAGGKYAHLYRQFVQQSE